MRSGYAEPYLFSPNRGHGNLDTPLCQRLILSHERYLRERKEIRRGNFLVFTCYAKDDLARSCRKQRGVPTLLRDLRSKLLLRAFVKQKRFGGYQSLSKQVASRCRRRQVLDVDKRSIPTKYIAYLYSVPMQIAGYQLLVQAKSINGLRGDLVVLTFILPCWPVGQGYARIAVEDRLCLLAKSTRVLLIQEIPASVM